MTYDSRSVANEFMRLAKANGFELTPMQAIKLTYLAHGWMLGLYDRPLLTDDVEAWQYGPVIRRVYNALKKYGGRPVTAEISDAPAGPEASGEEHDVIKQVYDLYGHLDGVQLSTLTHQPDTPWDIVWKRYGQNVVIPQDLIARHFRDLAKERAV